MYVNERLTCLVALVVLGGCACAAHARPEMTWSVMHPTEVDVAYLRRVLEKASEYGQIDSIEICGDCADADNGINGTLDFTPYPHAKVARDPQAIAAYTDKLNTCVRLCHAAGKRVYLWHREGYLPKDLVKDVPALVDANGEYDILGKDYLAFLRWKLSAGFDRVPDLDGLVLTLTEADFSVIHNSNPSRYPPVRVVEAIARVFREEHERRGKRFVFRSFGSVASDYESLLAGAAAAAKGGRPFEVETKATAYDFDPFLPTNPFLRKIQGCTLGVECDGLGEYLGAGYLPAAQVGQIVRYVREATAKGAARYAVRIDRVGNSIFDSAQEVNLFAYMRLVADPALTTDHILDEWAAKRWPRCRMEMKRLARMGYDLVTKTQFVDGNVIFHMNPVTPSFLHLKACGIFAVFRNDADLHMMGDQWGMLAGRKTPGRRAIRAEKDEAIRLADGGLSLLESVRQRLDPAEYARQHRVWSIATKATRAVRAFIGCACAYFDDMETDDAEARSLVREIATAERMISSMMENPAAAADGYDIYNARAAGENLDHVYFIPLRWLCRAFLDEYRAEYRARTALKAQKDVLDFVIPGGIFDDNRVDRTHHASYQDIDAGVPVRTVGNSVFPNAEMSVEFRDVPGAEPEVVLDPARGARSFRCVTSVANGVCRVTISKDGTDYPVVRAVVQRNKAGKD